MKRLLLLAMGFCLCIGISSAGATLITYDITGGKDNAGYDFSGFVTIDSDFSLASFNSSGNIPYTRIYYNITNFVFVSYAGINYGHSGELRFDVLRVGDANEFVVYPGASSYFYNDYTVNFVGMSNTSLWYNPLQGVLFVGAEATLEGYSVLPDLIVLVDFLPFGGTWTPKGSIWLTRASFPVPEPSTMLLLATGLVGLAGFRKKFKGE